MEQCAQGRLRRAGGLGGVVRLLLVTVGVACAAPALAAAEDATYSYTQTIPVAPASTYAGSGGGDGWALAMTPQAVYNVFHHSSQLQVACHLQSDASSCWNPKTITDAEGNGFRVSGQPALQLDQGNGHLHVFATRSADATAGVVCIDTTRPATDANLFCGYTPLTPAGGAPESSAVSNAARIGTRWYAFNFSGGAPAGAGQNVLLCFETAGETPCAGQPFAVGLGSGTVSVPSPTYRVPSIAGIGTRVLVPANVGSEVIGCFDAATGAACSGSWPTEAPSGYSDNYGPAFPTLTAGGEPTGFCLPASGLPCFGLDGATAATPSGLTSAIDPGTPWNGPAFVLGPRIYVANGNGDKVQCYSFASSQSCDGFPKALSNAGYLYTVNPDPQRPECIWVNADNGSGQIQNFDAYTGASCGRGALRVLASSIVVPNSRCQPTGYTSMRIVFPERSAYTSGTVAFLDGDAKPIAGIADRAIDGSGLISMTGLDLSTSTGLPQFLITLEGASSTPGNVVVELVWRGVVDESCVKPETNTREYQALGDSFSSGFGNDPFYPGTHKDGVANDCQRSTRAFSQVPADFFDLNRSFHACQGAETRDFYAGRTRDSSWNERPQLDNLSASTGLVTFSIGGNDAHFATVIRDCIDGYELLPTNTCHGDDRIKNPVREAIDRLNGRRATPTDIHPYDQIFKDVRRRAPFSDRVVVGYPDFFPDDGGDRTFLPGGRCEGVKKADQRWIVERIHEVDDIIRTTALRNGFRYADPGKFAGHELCSGGDEWFGGAIAGILGSNGFHPTVDGQKTLGDAVVKALTTRDAEGDTFSVGPTETVIGSTRVGPGQLLLSIVSQWPGSDVPLTLVSPSGVRYTREAPGAGVKHEFGPTWEQYEVPTPEPGLWTFELYGKDVDPQGEPVRVLATTEPFANVPPLAKVSFVENADGTLTFSSAQSSDPDGQIVKRQWYVSAGADTEDTAAGEAVTVARGAGGKDVTLVVTDDRGATTFASAIIPKVAAPGTPPGAPGAPVVTTPAGKPVAPVTDRIAPKVTKLSLQRAVKRGKRTVWKATKSLTGTVRLRLTLSEPATLTVKLTAARAPKKPRSKVVKATRGGVVTIALSSTVKGLKGGKAKLAVSAEDRAGNVGAKVLNVKK